MLKKINIPAPQFLQRYDRYLLLHHPDIWASRIHIVLFYGGALLSALLIHAWFRPLALNDLPDPDQQFIWAAIPSLLVFGPFAYHLSLFNVERDFGFRASGFDFRQQVSLGVSILLLAAIPFLYASILSERIATSIEDEYLIQDNERLNMGDVYFPAYTYVFEDNMKADRSYNFERHKYRLYGQGYFHAKWNAIGQYHLQKFHSESDYSRVERLAQVQAYIQAFNRYSERKIKLSPEEALTLFEQKQIPVRKIKADKEQIDDNLTMLLHAKEGIFTFQRTKTMHFSALFLLGIWTVLLLFLKMRIKDFSIGLLTGSAAAMIIFAGLSWISDWWNITPGNLLFPLFFSLFIFLFSQISRKSHSKIIHNWKTIALMWLTCMVPLVPMVTAVSNKNIPVHTAYTFLYLGFGLLVLLWNVFLNKQFTLLLARPTEN